MWLIFGSLMVLLGVGWGTFNIVDLIAHEEYTVSYEVSAAGITRIDIDNDNGSVTVVGMDTDTDMVRVTAEVSESLRGTGHSHDVVDSTLEVRGSCPLIGDLWCRVTYTIEVPHRFDVEVNSDNSRVDVSNVDGDISIESDNGAIELSSITGSLRLNTNNGRIVGTDLSGPAADVGTDNGSIELRFSAVPDEVIAESNNGSIEIVVPPVEEGYNVTTETDNGSEAILVVSSDLSPYGVDVQTNNGDITVRSTE